MKKINFYVADFFFINTYTDFGLIIKAQMSQFEISAKKFKKKIGEVKN